MMFMDCYVYDANGFPEATYVVPDGVCRETLRSAALVYYNRVVFVEESNGQSPQDLPSDWLKEVTNG